MKFLNSINVEKEEVTLVTMLLVYCEVCFQQMRKSEKDKEEQTEEGNTPKKKNTRKKIKYR